MISAVKPDEMPPARLIGAYGFLALPLAFAGLPLYIHIPDFYTRDMGLGIASAGLILMALRLLDAVQDPLIGFISDKSAFIQRTIMGVGIMFLLIGMGALLMGPPSFVPVPHWFAGTVGLTALGLSMVNINLVMIGSLWGRDDQLRGRASGVREGLSLIGMLFASVLPGILMLSMSRPQAFEVFYVIFAVLLLVGAAAFRYFYKSLPGNHEIFVKAHQTHTARLPFHFFKQNSGFLGACFLTYLAAAFPAVLFLYFTTDYLGAGDKTGLFLFLYFLSGVACMGGWLKIAAKFSAERAWLFSMILAICSFIGAFSLSEGDILLFGIICVLSGAALGADLALPPIILARRLDLQNGTSYATQAYAVLNLIPKIALAIGTGCAFLLLDNAGFSPSGDNTADALWLLAALYALAPCLIKGLSAFIVFNLHNGATHDTQKRSNADGHTYGA